MLLSVFKSVAGLLVNIAPTFASALGSPLAGAAVKALAKAFGVAEKEPEKIPPKILHDVPSAVEKLKDLEKNRVQHLGPKWQDYVPKDVHIDIELK